MQAYCLNNFFKVHSQKNVAEFNIFLNIQINAWMNFIDIIGHVTSCSHNIDNNIHAWPVRNILQNWFIDRRKIKAHVSAYFSADILYLFASYDKANEVT